MSDDPVHNHPDMAWDMAWQTIDTAPNDTTILTYGSRRPGVITPVPVVAQKRLRQSIGGRIYFEWVGFADHVQAIAEPVYWMQLPKLPLLPPPPNSKE